LNPEGYRRVATFIYLRFLTRLEPSSSGVSAGDLNADGKLDLICSGFGGSVFHAFLGNGDGSFQQPKNFESGRGSNSVALGDLNNDGKLDVVIGNLGVSIFLGIGDGTFMPPVDYSAARTFSVAIGDFNRDANPDLALAVEHTVDISVLRGNGDGTFQPALQFAADGYSNGIAVGDFNRDGNPDLAAAIVSNGFLGLNNGVVVLMGNGDATFQRPALYGAGLAPRAVTVADLDADGQTDLAVANQGVGQPLAPSVSVLLGNGDGTLRSAVNHHVRSFANGVTVADFDLDGMADLGVSSSLGGLSVLLGAGKGTFHPFVNFSEGDYLTGVVAGDFNSDGKPDVASAGFQLSGKLFLNTCDPAGPRLSIEKAGNFVTLSWPEPSPDFVLQSASRFDYSAWSPVLESAKTNENRLELTFPLSDPERYFRLQRK
jgi:hypothetical protein